MREWNGNCRVQVGQKFMKFYLENLKGESIWKEKYENYRNWVRGCVPELAQASEKDEMGWTCGAYG